MDRPSSGHFAALAVNGCDMRAERLDMNVDNRIGATGRCGHSWKRADFFLKFSGAAMRFPQAQFLRDFQMHLDK